MCSMASVFGTAQPFRYRGYVRDEETGLYYLRSRFYNTKVCRFVNEDNRVVRRSFANLFTYCGNAPIGQIDPDGQENVCFEFPDVIQMGETISLFSVGEFYRIRPSSEGVYGTNLDTGKLIKIYTMYDDKDEPIYFSAKWTGKEFTFFYEEYEVALKQEKANCYGRGDEWAYYLGYNTESVVPDTHRPRRTTLHTQMALSYATGIPISWDGTFCIDSMNATKAFQKQYEGMEVDGWPGACTKEWLLEAFKEAQYDVDNNPPP